MSELRFGGSLVLDGGNLNPTLSNGNENINDNHLRAIMGLAGTQIKVKDLLRGPPV